MSPHNPTGYGEGMLGTDERTQQRLAERVGALERRTAAELVVVVAARSGSYWDVALALGAAGGAAVLALGLWSPWVFSPLGLWLDLALGVPGLALLAHRQPALLRWVCSQARLARQVEQSAAAAFWQERVYATRARVGVLVYVSALERRAWVLPDLGVEQALPPELQGDPGWVLTDETALLAALDTLGAALAAALPPVEGARESLADAPRVRA